MAIKKGDTVKILTGKDAGKTGAVLKTFPAENRLTVESINLMKKRVRPTKQGQKGETVLVPRPIPASRAMLICTACKVPTRTGYRFEGDKKVRVCKRCHAAT